jgi:hypothetical protein
LFPLLTQRPRPPLRQRPQRIRELRVGNFGACVVFHRHCATYVTDIDVVLEELAGIIAAL